MSGVSLTIDGTAVEAAPGTTVLDAARAAGLWIPTLCFDDRMAPFGACRVCLVGVEGARGPLASCTTQVREGMVVETQHAQARRIARNVVELVLSELPEPPAPHTELAVVAARLGLDPAAGPAARRWAGATHEPQHDLRHPYLALRHELCISCGRCVRACDEVQGAFALTAVNRGFHANITAGLGHGFAASSCVSCGACADTCPTDAISDRLLVELAGGAPRKEL